MIRKEERDLALQIRTIDSRSKSNEHRIDKHDSEIKDIRDKQDAIYELASSVKSIAKDMSFIKTDVSEVKESQKELTTKVNELENRPAKEVHLLYKNLKDKIAWVIIGGAVVAALRVMLPNINW